jgi:hypothetical protein
MSTFHLIYHYANSPDSCLSFYIGSRHLYIHLIVTSFTVYVHLSVNPLSVRSDHRQDVLGTPLLFAIDGTLNNDCRISSHFSRLRFFCPSACLSNT